MQVQKQVQTERGLLWIEEEFETAQQAKDAGYTYAFTSHQLNSDMYSICLDDRGLRHQFARVRRSA